MKLIELLMPNPNFFYVALPGNQQAFIEGYKNINISFEEHISYREGVRETTTKPTIEYSAVFNTSNAAKLSRVFKSNEFGRIYRQVSAVAVLGDSGYRFKVFISAIPDVLKGTLDEGVFYRQGPKGRYVDSNGNIIVKILLKLDDMKEGCLFEDAEIVYNEYKEKKNKEIEEISRFDLMEI